MGFVRTRIVGMEEASVARASPGPDGIALQPLEDDEQVLEAITRSNFNPDQVKLMVTAKIGVGRGESTPFPPALPPARPATRHQGIPFITAWLTRHNVHNPLHRGRGDGPA